MKDLKTRISEAERKYFLLKDEAEKLKSQLQVAEDEVMMTRGEYRLLVNMKKEQEEEGAYQKKKAEEDAKKDCNPDCPICEEEEQEKAENSTEKK